MGQGKDVTQEGPYGIWTHDPMQCSTRTFYPYGPEFLAIRAWISTLYPYALPVRSTRTLYPYALPERSTRALFQLIVY